MFFSLYFSGPKQTEGEGILISKDEPRKMEDIVLPNNRPKQTEGEDILISKDEPRKMEEIVLPNNRK
ncbi:hypothetical protein NDU88_005663 [Pleurodeles waltl]|uniref:Uncharacterized protein n=1 Tax=Pleurodeles waltl TaxID=8319 RepID=A0AAV7WVB6_PLEWA|nr:hypothetical protein NDU88_005663 [Pleurodeles waltl]